MDTSYKVSIVLSFAVSFLFSFFPVSQLVIEEVSVIQENLEIERTCRESAEALASKVQFASGPVKTRVMMPSVLSLTGGLTWM